MSPNQYFMTSNHVSLISAFKMTFRITFWMTFRMTFRMTLKKTFKTWDFRGVFNEDFEGDLEGDSKGDFRGDFKQDMDMLSSSGQVRSRLGWFLVWFSLQPKFNSFELDSEVGRLVNFFDLRNDFSRYFLFQF